MLKTTLAGSLPKPAWLADPGAQLFAPWAQPADRLGEAQDDAVRLAIADQEEAGIDIISDGEQRRRHYIWGFLEGLTGTDTVRLGRKRTRGGKYVAEQDVARITGKLTRAAPIMVPALAFAKAHTRRPVKVTLPAPMTLVDTTLDEHYKGDEESLAMRRQLGDKKGIATSLTNMGLVAYELADYASARMQLEESLVICRELGDRAGIASSLCPLGDVATEEGALLSARALYAESAAMRLELGDRRGIVESLEGLANVALALTRPLRAACIWGAAERLRADIGLPIAPAQRPRYESRVQAARVACANDTAFEAAWREGNAMTVEQAIAYAEQADAY